VHADVRRRVVGEASEDCLAPKRGFPLPNFPRLGEGIFSIRSSYAMALRLGGGDCSEPFESYMRLPSIVPRGAGL
jgi:hypothetical protein